MTTAPFEIKVVYDAAQRKRRGVVVRSSQARSAIAPGKALAIGALLHLAVAGGMYYVTWWMADPDLIYMNLIKRTPMEVSKDFAANPFGISAQTFQPPSEEVEAESPTPADVESVTPPRWSGKTAQTLIGATAYGWLALATASACAVAMAGGAWLGVGGGKWVRTLGFIGLFALFGGLCFFGYKIWSESQMMFEPKQLRRGMGLLTLLLALIGLAFAGKARGITKLAGVTVILAAIGTAVGIWLWTQSGALDLQYAAWPKLAGAFAIHAAWGFVLLVTANRIRV